MGGGGAVMALQNWGPLLLTAAARDGLHGWDPRTDTKAFSLAGTPHQVRPEFCQLWLLWVDVKLLVVDCNKLHGWDLRTDTKAFSLSGSPHQVRRLDSVNFGCC